MKIIFGMALSYTNLMITQFFHEGINKAKMLHAVKNDTQGYYSKRV